MAAMMARGAELQPPSPAPVVPSLGKMYACVGAGTGENLCMEAGPGTAGVSFEACKAMCKAGRVKATGRLRKPLRSAEDLTAEALVRHEMRLAVARHDQRRNTTSAMAVGR